MTGPSGPRDYEWSPGTGGGAGGALTVGVNRLPPDGLIDFSVGVTDADVLGVVVDVSGAFSLSATAGRGQTDHCDDCSAARDRRETANQKT